MKCDLNWPPILLHKGERQKKSHIRSKIIPGRDARPCVFTTYNYPAISVPSGKFQLPESWHKHGQPWVSGRQKFHIPVPISGCI